MTFRQKKGRQPKGWHEGLPVDVWKTLTEIEGKDWGEPNYDSHLVTRVHALRKIPLRDFSVEDFRIMLGQSLSPGILLPLALEILEKNPLVSGDFFDGDLLLNSIRAAHALNEPTYLEKLRALALRAEESLRKSAEEYVEELFQQSGGTIVDADNWRRQQVQRELERSALPDILEARSKPEGEHD